MAAKTVQQIYRQIENLQYFAYTGTELSERVSFRTDYGYVICGNSLHSKISLGSFRIPGDILNKLILWIGINASSYLRLTAIM